MILIIVDSTIKWIEAIPIASTLSATTIATLHALFAHLDIPKTVLMLPVSWMQTFRIFLNIQVLRITCLHHIIRTRTYWQTVLYYKRRHEKVNLWYFFWNTFKCIVCIETNTYLPSLGIESEEAFVGLSLWTRLDLHRPDYIHVLTKHTSIPNIEERDNVWTR